MICYHGIIKEEATIILKEGFTENQNKEWGANLYLAKNIRMARLYGNTVIKCEIDDKYIVEMSIDEANKIGRSYMHDKCIKEKIKCLEIIDKDGKLFGIFVFDKRIVKPLGIIKKTF